LNDPKRAQAIDELYGFANKDFVPLSVKHDVFSVQLLAEQAARVEALVQKHSEAINSEDWNAVKVFRTMRTSFFPPGSTRERLARFIWHPILRYFQKKPDNTNQ
jgi:hypothetical protein